MFGATVADDELKSALNNADLPVIAASATPVTALFESKDNRETSVLLKSSDTTIFVPYDADESFDFDSQDQTSMNLVVEGKSFVLLTARWFLRMSLHLVPPK